MNQPNLGDLIEHRDTMGTTFTGKVTMILSAQFVYDISKTAAVFTRFCLFSEDWIVIKKAKVRRKK